MVVEKGTTDISAIYFGTTEIQYVYFGTTEVYPNTPAADNTPNAVDWSNIEWYTGPGYGTYTGQQITGISSSITLRAEYTQTNIDLYYRVSSTTLSEPSEDPPTEGYTLVNNNGTFSVSNNEYVYFMCEGGNKDTISVTIKNTSDGNATLDTFSMSTRDSP